MDAPTLAGPETAHGYSDGYLPWPTVYQQHWYCSELDSPPATTFLGGMENGPASLESNSFYCTPCNTLSPQIGLTSGPLDGMIEYSFNSRKDYWLHSPVSPVSSSSAWMDDIGTHPPPQERLPLDHSLATTSVGRSQEYSTSMSAQPGSHRCPRCRDKSFSRLRDLR